MPESYQTPYAASGRGPSDDDFMTRSMFQDGLHYDLVAMDAVTQLSTAHLRLLAQSGRRLAESLDPAATLAAVSELIVPALADWCIVDLVGDDGTVERAAVAHADS